MELKLKEAIKAKIIESGYTMTQVVKMLNEKYGRTDTIQNFSNKLTNGAVKYKDVVEILDIIGYEVAWIPKDSSK
jgi:hypothetical protein